MLLLLGLVHKLRFHQLPPDLPLNIPQLANNLVMFLQHLVIVPHVNNFELVSKLYDVVGQVVDFHEFVLLQIEQFYF